MTKAAELAKMGEVLTNSQIGGRRNMVINGAMQVAQRATSYTNIGNNDSGYRTVDRFRIGFGGSTAGRLTMTQESITDLSGFANAIKFACTTADTSIASNEFGTLSTRFEGQDLQQLKKGTSDAEAVTVSFYVKGNANATYALELYDAVGGRHASQLFNVTSSWNRVSLTFNGDTTDTLADSNALALELNIWFHAGSNYTSGTISADFASADNTRRAAGISSFFDSTDRTFFITGLQMEVGSQATPFEHRSFGEELALCRRYYYQLGNVQLPASSSPPYGRVGQGQAISGTVGRVPFFFPQAMRAIPTAEVNNIQIGNGATGAINLTDAGIDTNTDSPDGVTIDFTVSSGLTSGQGCQAFQGNNSAGFVAFKAEL
jgi:hypothetical protein